MFTIEELGEAADLVARHMAPTPQIAWPLLERETGVKVWVKHENHTPIGAFKIRGGITFIDWLKRTRPDVPGIVTATRGNHGQSLARAARRAGLDARVIVPAGNSVEKNAAMVAFGATLEVFGDDFDSAKGEAERIAAEEGLFLVPPFHRELVRGVATASLELLRAVPDLHSLYVPIGCGSGICGAIAVRDVLASGTRIIGVVSTGARTAQLSREAGHLVETNAASTFADGIAVRVPVQEALDIYGDGVEDIIAVSDEEIVDAMLCMLRTTHNVAEGAGAAALAAVRKSGQVLSGKPVGVVLSGGNIDLDWLRHVLDGKVPPV